MIQLNSPPLSTFKIDQQSLKDLNIFSGTSGSVFNIFKATRTIGGREKLREMMDSPSSNINVLSQRKDAIKYFHDQQLEIELKNEQLDLIAYYLKFTKRYSRNNLLDAVVDFIKSRSTNDYYIIKTGIKGLIALVQYIQTFLDNSLGGDIPPYLTELSAGIHEIIDSKNLKHLLKLNSKKLNFYQINRLDYLCRGKERKKLKALLELIYEFDVFETVARVAVEKDLCFPEYIASTEMYIAISGLAHPKLAHPVTNDLTLKNEKNMVLLTGSNMAGKSSFLKSLGIALYLSHIGFPVFAKKMETTIFNGLITTINLPDDINNGLSHYLSEVKRLKEAASSLLEQENMFIMFDELFRGTNVKDAFDASLAVISELSKVKNSVFFISTHIVELAEKLENFNNISYKYMETLLEEEKPIFTYKLREGVAQERVGMYIIKNEGLLEMIKQAYHVQQVKLKQHT
ncbi:MutS-related protein [Pedobacter sp.]|uniref:MutS-related protein n=1 Tax=Pedobacter sp. TaxID=1411316 RepID=UPI003D7F59FC